MANLGSAQQLQQQAGLRARQVVVRPSSDFGQVLSRCYLLAFSYGRGVMDLVQMREVILSRDVTPVEKAQTFIKEKAVWKPSKAQWDLWTLLSSLSYPVSAD